MNPSTNGGRGEEPSKGDVKSRVPLDKARVPGVTLWC